MHNFSWSLALILGLTMAGCGDNQVTPDIAEPSEPSLVGPLPHDPMGVTTHRLPNGLTVFIATDRQRPTIDTRIVVRAGSADEPANATGLAHYLEHMMFKGSTQLGTTDYASEQGLLVEMAALYRELRAPGADVTAVRTKLDALSVKASQFQIANELPALYAQLGITKFNAYTGEDFTRYHAAVPTNQFANWAQLEADRFTSPVFRGFWTEMEVVYEELNRSHQGGVAAVTQLATRTLYGDHPYSRTILGEPEHLKLPAYNEMIEFFERFYVPSNMAIVLVGDIDAATALPILTKAFAGFSRTAPPPQPARHVPPPMPRTADAVTSVFDGRILAWQTVAANHPDALGLELLKGILQTELTKALTNQGLAIDVPVRLVVRHDDIELSVLQVYADVARAAATETATQAVLSKLHNNISEEDVTLARLQLQQARQANLEDPSAKADILTVAYGLRRPWADVVDETPRLAAYNAADMMRLAQRYLRTPHARINITKGTFVLPSFAKPHITPTSPPAGRSSALFETIRNRQVPTLTPYEVQAGRDYQVTTHPTGDLVTVRNPYSQAYELNVYIPLGSETHRGVCVALEALGQAGTASLGKADFDRRLGLAPATLNVACAPTELQISLKGLDQGFEQARDLMAAHFRDLAIAPEAYAHGRQYYAAMVPLFRTFADPLMAELTRRPRRATPYPEPTTAEIMALDDTVLRETLRLAFATKPMITYFGPRPHAAVMDLVTQLGGTASAPNPPAQQPRPARPQVAYASFEGPTSMVRLALTSPTSGLTGLAHASLYLTLHRTPITGRLFVELRDRRALAYSTSAAYEFSDDAASLHLIAELQTQADKTNDAADALLELMATPVTPAEYAAAQTTAEAKYRAERIAPRDLGPRVVTWRKLGFQADPRAALRAAQASLPRETYVAWFREALQHAALLVVGPTTSFAPARLSAHGEMREIPVEALLPN